MTCCKAINVFMSRGKDLIVLYVACRIAFSFTVQSPKKWLVRGLVKFAPAAARLVCPDLLG